jgi:ketosteroid isomerase-like protein
MNFNSRASFLGFAAILVLGIGTVALKAQTSSETDAVGAANQAFEAALSMRDIRAMEMVWSQGPEAMVIHPNAKAVEIGWDAVKKSWEGAFGRFSELSATMKDPQVRVVGDAAWVVGVEEVKGKRASGEAIGYSALATNIFEKRGGRWVMVLHQVSRIPQ